MDVYEAVVLRLSALGYQTTGDDEPGIKFLASKCRGELLANINHKEVPEGLFYTLVDMVAGSFLHEKLAAGGLDIEGINLAQQPKSITEGDVRVDFAGASDGASSAEALFRSQLDKMMHPPESALGAFRRLRW